MGRINKNSKQNDLNSKVKKMLTLKHLNILITFNTTENIARIPVMNDIALHHFHN